MNESERRNEDKVIFDSCMFVMCYRVSCQGRGGWRFGFLRACGCPGFVFR